jgi:N-acetylglucosaminyldiphosphoundecaprenol N-acetyl-beta-D-mannosaminyltransferase
MERDQSLYVIGSGDAEVRKCVENIKAQYPKLVVCGYRNGFFRTEGERSAALEEITRLSPDFVFVGMGTPAQELFLMDLRRSWSGTGIACGAFIHQTAKRLMYYPGLINKSNLRWAFRVMEEPGKVLRRIFRDYTRFVGVFGLDFVRFKRDN